MNRQRHHQTGVVVGVLANQIDAPRRSVATRSCAEPIDEFSNDLADRRAASGGNDLGGTLHNRYSRARGARLEAISVAYPATSRGERSSIIQLSQEPAGRSHAHHEHGDNEERYR